MRLLCPECYQPLDLQLLACSNAHQYTVKDGVLVLLAEEFKEELQLFSATLSQMRADSDKRLTDPAVYDLLPCAPSVQHNKEWRIRCWDLQLVKQAIGEHLGPRPLTILDVGAYNGWLSHSLARLGHEVTGIDYFRDPRVCHGAANGRSFLKSRRKSGKSVLCLTHVWLVELKKSHLSAEPFLAAAASLSGRPTGRSPAILADREMIVHISSHQLPGATVCTVKLSPAKMVRPNARTGETGPLYNASGAWPLSCRIFASHRELTTLWPRALNRDQKPPN